MASQSNICSFSTSFISYGIAYNMDALAGTVYVNVIILGAARWAINIIAALLEYTIKSIGRRLLHLVSVGFVMVVMAVTFVIYIFTCASFLSSRFSELASAEENNLLS